MRHILWYNKTLINLNFKSFLDKFFINNLNILRMTAMVKIKVLESINKCLYRYFDTFIDKRCKLQPICVSKKAQIICKMDTVSPYGANVF